MLTHHFRVKKHRFFSELAKAGFFSHLGNSFAYRALAGSDKADRGLVNAKMISGFPLIASPLDKGKEGLIGCFAICHVTHYGLTLLYVKQYFQAGEDNGGMSRKPSRLLSI